MKAPQAGRSPEAGASCPRAPSPLLHHWRAMSLCSCLSRPVSLIPPGYHRPRTLLLSPGALRDPNLLGGLSLHRGLPLRLPPSPSLPAPTSGSSGSALDPAPRSRDLWTLPVPLRWTLRLVLSAGNALSQTPPFVRWHHDSPVSLLGFCSFAPFGGPCLYGA